MSQFWVLRACVEALLVTARGDLRAYEDTHWLQLLESHFPCLGPQAPSPPPQPAYFEPRDSLNTSHSASFSTVNAGHTLFGSFLLFNHQYQGESNKAQEEAQKGQHAHNRHARRQLRGRKESTERRMPTSGFCH